MARDYFGDMDEIQEEEFKSAPPRFSNYEGQKYGEWTVVKRITSTDYICRCSCGFQAERKLYSIQTKSTRCINCYRKSVSCYDFKANTVKFNKEV